MRSAPRRRGEKAELRYGDEVYRLNEDLLQAAFRLTKDVELADSDAAKAYRAKYAEASATAPPQVSICDTISSDTWWHGARLGAAMEAYAKLVTDGEANPCTTQQEDNATLTALERGAEANLVDFNRIAILRTASNFDREAPGQSAAEFAQSPLRRLSPLGDQRLPGLRQARACNRRRLGDVERGPAEVRGMRLSFGAALSERLRCHSIRGNRARRMRHAQFASDRRKAERCSMRRTRASV